MQYSVNMFKNVAYKIYSSRRKYSPILIYSKLVAYLILYAILYLLLTGYFIYRLSMQKLLVIPNQKVFFSRNRVRSWSESIFFPNSIFDVDVFKSLP